MEEGVLFLQQMFLFMYVAVSPLCGTCQCVRPTCVIFHACPTNRLNDIVENLAAVHNTGLNTDFVGKLVRDGLASFFWRPSRMCSQAEDSEVQLHIASYL